jgi:N6-L-threonylcarbamoyladenine synthase
LGYSASKKKDNNTSFNGGIIPNVARLLHHDNLVFAVSDCINQMPKGWKNIDAIALTVKPGLEPCLWEGIQFTKLLLKKYKLPFIPVHHMEAHALMPRLFDKNIQYPFLTLLISGGHCILALVENETKFYR